MRRIIEFRQRNRTEEQQNLVRDKLYRHSCLSDQQIPVLRRDVQLHTLQNCICHSALNVLLPQVYYRV